MKRNTDITNLASKFLSALFFGDLNVSEFNFSPDRLTIPSTALCSKPGFQGLRITLGC